MSIIGPGIAGDSLANLTHGSLVSPRLWYLRFRAERTSEISSLRVPFLSADYPGYGAGTGGDWSLSLCQVDRTTLMPILSTRRRLAAMAAHARSSNGRRIDCDPCPVVGGQLYALVTENVDHDPAVNWFSLNTWLRRDAESPRQPRFPDSDWACGYLRLDGSALVERSGHTPIAEIGYAGGHAQGMSYGEAQYPVPGVPPEHRVGLVQGAHVVRTRFTLAAAVTLGDLHIRAMREGERLPIVATIWRGAGFVGHRVFMVDDSTPTGPAPTTDRLWDSLGARARWLRSGPGEPIRLEAGREYELRFMSGGRWWTWPMRRLTHEYGYHPATAFNGITERSHDAGLTWHPLGRVPCECDLQWYGDTQ